MMHINEKIWKGKKKTDARKYFIDYYRKYFNVNRIPESAQYWTISGQCTTKTGNKNHESEIGQILKEKLISEKQFHGVDIDKEIVASNQNAFPNANWFCGDFYRTLYEASGNENFSPAIVNADTLYMPENAANYAVSLMSTLSYCPNEVMLVVNMILKYQNIKRKNYDVEYFREQFNNVRVAPTVLSRASWILPHECYSYNGTGDDSRTRMGTVIFIKERNP